MPCRTVIQMGQTPLRKGACPLWSPRTICRISKLKQTQTDRKEGSMRCCELCLADEGTLEAGFLQVRPIPIPATNVKTILGRDSVEPSRTLRGRVEGRSRCWMVYSATLSRLTRRVMGCRGAREEELVVSSSDWESTDQNDSRERPRSPAPRKRASCVHRIHVASRDVLLTLSLAFTFFSTRARLVEFQFQHAAIAPARHQPAVLLLALLVPLLS
jgi:hypothetical protein